MIVSGDMANDEAAELYGAHAISKPYKLEDLSAKNRETITSRRTH
jgi:hypothetical protein